MAGAVEPALGPGLHDHVCWAFRDPAEFRAEAWEFLRDGLARGRQVWYVGDADPRSADGLGEALRTGAARVVPLEAVYPTGTVDPVAQARKYVEATRDAVASGCTGLRVAVDCTPRVMSAGQLDAFARYEHEVDRCTTAQPFSVMCGYDRGRVGEDVVARVACLHPMGNTDPGFRLVGSASHAAALAGELDVSTGDLFAEALRRTDPRPADGKLVLDATGLRFLDHQSLIRLAEHAADRAATLVLRTSWPGATRLVELLGLPSIQVEETA